MGMMCRSSTEALSGLRGGAVLARSVAVVELMTTQRHPLASSTRHWPAEAREELKEREDILAADGLPVAEAEAQVRRSWLVWDPARLER